MRVSNAGPHRDLNNGGDYDVLRQQRTGGIVSHRSEQHDQNRGGHSREQVRVPSGARHAHGRAVADAHRTVDALSAAPADQRSLGPGDGEFPRLLQGHGDRGSEAADEERHHRAAEERRRLVRRLPRRTVRGVPGGVGQDVAAGRRRHEDALRDAARTERTRDASPRAAHDDSAVDRPGAASHASDAGPDGSGERRAAGAAVIRVVAAAIVAAVMTAGMAAHPSTGSEWPEPVEGQVPAVSHEYADVNGVRLHYARAGRGPLIVFLHGFPEFWYEWRDQLAEFGRDHTAVAPDMRGYNLSSKPRELSEYRMPYLVSDVHALANDLLKASGGSTFTLVAHDWGGVVAWVFAAQHPELLDKLVIINAPHPTIFGRELRDNAAQQQASQYMLMFRGEQAEATLSANSYAGLVNAILGEGLKNGTVTEEDKKAYIEAWSQPGALTGGLNYYRAAAVGPPRPGETASPLTAQPLLVRVPTLVIWAEKATARLTGNLNGLDQYVTKLTVRRIPDATHWVVREKSGEVNRAIREFLSQ